MRIIKLIVASIISLSLIITIISLFIPTHIRISRAVQIYSSREAVLNEIADPRQWKNWYPGADSSAYFYEKGIVKGLVLNEKKKQSIVMVSESQDEVKAIYHLPNRNIETGWQLI